MKTKYKHIRFEEQDTLWLDKPLWAILNNKTKGRLGQVFWYEPWRKYVTALKETAVFDEGCHRDIANFLDQLK